MSLECGYLDVPVREALHEQLLATTWIGELWCNICYTRFQQNYYFILV